MPWHCEVRDDAQVVAQGVFATSVQALNAFHQDAPMTRG